MVLPIPSCVTLSEPQFLNLKIGDNNGNYLVGECEIRPKSACEAWQFYTQHTVSVS